MRKIFKYFTTLGLGLVTALAVAKTSSASSYFNSKYYTNNIPSGYYDDVDLTKSSSNIKLDLYDIISANYNKHSYKENNTVLKYTDPDPSGNGNIICLYTGQSLSGGWNKEHVWAKSHGFPGSSTEPYSDAHHLRPTLTTINSSRSNLDFGEVSGGKSDSYGNKWDSYHFEPRDEVKGDVARMMFYMETRYGAKTSFNLKLVNDSTTSASDTNGKFGNLQTLIKWHYEDPVSKEEIYRNNVIYENYQHNRNPYIDHPEYVDYVYPSDYSTNIDVDSKKVETVISLIKAIPDTITLDLEATIIAAKDAYDALNAKEKALVTNYDKLQKAISDLNELKDESGGSDIKDDVTDTESLTISFTNISNYGYTADKTVTIDDKSFYTSYSGSFNYLLRLGNKNTASVPSKYGVSGDASALEMQYNVSNIQSVNLTFSKSYGTVSKYYVLISKDNGQTYEKVKEESFTSSTTSLNVSFDTPVSGRIAFIIAGTTPRLDLTTLEIKTSSSTTPSKGEKFAKYETLASLNFNWYQNDGIYSTSNLSLRFGTIIDKDVYDSNAKYGILLIKQEMLDDEDLKSYLDDLKSNVTLDELVELVNLDNMGLKKYELNPAQVDSVGQASLNGDYYQFAGVITEIEDYSCVMSAVMYMETENGIYFTNSSTYSINSIVEYYINNAQALEIENEDILGSLESILNN